eukprot:CAMPEP_0119114056 /NCGR_PEP_ID=MMETSP1180-20130426/46040_1 /TAXON_ID=3052 ORGANISM="Chlamydomonas cf sp, Strain CCMP681" /NCGR_SAMPLE_ID=MMETSP1180 /ASSEMBLY_ACC=CAM_ASM_000741 /LENGTH=70 /DNA_ID=CAMNT_0007102405 /DNA_START=117 /DNA_END=325 /DNA_ORIENTATION=-
MRLPLNTLIYRLRVATKFCKAAQSCTGPRLLPIAAFLSPDTTWLADLSTCWCNRHAAANSRAKAKTAALG